MGKLGSILPLDRVLNVANLFFSQPARYVEFLHEQQLRVRGTGQVFCCLYLLSRCSCNYPTKDLTLRLRCHCSARPFKRISPQRDAFIARSIVCTFSRFCRDIAHYAQSRGTSRCAPVLSDPSATWRRRLNAPSSLAGACAGTSLGVA